MHGPPSQLDPPLRTRIAANLAKHERFRADPEGLKLAAVALVLTSGDDGRPTFLLTRRPRSLSRHGGQFALPGGRLDAGEGPIDAARRELQEELGVALGAEAVLGLLDDFATRSGFVITPVVMWGAQVTRLAPDPGEVARVFRVPLSDLYREDVPLLTPVAGSAAPILSLPLVGTTVFSPTAAIIFQLREVALEGRATRVHHYEQPRFAWK